MARAIHRSTLPVVSAVGHEVDVTIADFVADSRAPTPSAAAELLSPDQRELAETFAGFEQLLGRQVLLKTATLKRELAALQARLRHPGSRLQDHNQRLDELELRLRNSWRRQQHLRGRELTLAYTTLQHQNPAAQIPHLARRVRDLAYRLQQQAQRQLERKQQRFNTSAQLLESVSPLATLNRGYSITTDSDGSIVRDTRPLQPGQTLHTRLAQGRVSSRIETVEES